MDAATSSDSLKKLLGLKSEPVGLAWLTKIPKDIPKIDKKERFWTGREFPEATVIREKILAYVRAHQTTGGSGGGYYESILEDCLKVSG